MNLLEGISLSSFILGGISMIVGLFLSMYPNFYSFTSGYYDGNIMFYSGAGLMIFFWAIAIGIASYSKVRK